MRIFSVSAFDIKGVFEIIFFITSRKVRKALNSKMKTVLVLSVLCAIACGAPTAVVYSSPVLAQVAGEAPASTVHATHVVAAPHIVAAPQVLSYSVPAVFSPPEVIQANLGPHQVLAHHVSAPHHIVSAYSLPTSVVSLKFQAIKQVIYDFFH